MLVNMADEDEVEEMNESEMKTSSSLQHMLAVIVEERKKETATFSISGGMSHDNVIVNHKII